MFPLYIGMLLLFHKNENRTISKSGLLKSASTHPAQKRLDVVLCKEMLKKQALFVMPSKLLERNPPMRLSSTPPNNFCKVNENQTISPQQRQGLNIPPPVEKELDILLKEAWKNAGNRPDEFINSPVHQRYANLIDELRAHTPSEGITLGLEPMSSVLKKLPNLNTHTLEVCSQHGGFFRFLKLDFNRATNFHMFTYTTASSFKDIKSLFIVLETLLERLPNSVTLVKNRDEFLHQLFERFNQAANELGITPINLNKRHKLRTLVPKTLKKLNLALDSVQKKEGTKRHKELINKYDSLLEDLDKLLESFGCDEDRKFENFLAKIAEAIQGDRALSGLREGDLEWIATHNSRKYRPISSQEKNTGKEGIIRIFNTLIQHHSQPFVNNEKPLPNLTVNMEQREWRTQLINALRILHPDINPEHEEAGKIVNQLKDISEKLF